MESKSSSCVDVAVTRALFSDLVRLETELWNAVDDRLRSRHRLPLSWFEPMTVVEGNPRCRVIDIAEALSITVGGTSKLVDRIVDAGWCAREPNPNDGRSSVIVLTPSGRRVLRAAHVTFTAELDLCLGAAMSPSALRKLGSTIQLLRHHNREHGRTE